MRLSLILSTTLLALAAPLWGLAPAKFNKVVEIGQQAPEWADLPGVDGKPHSLKDYAEAKVLVVVFLCNHCPVASGYEARFREFAGAYEAKGVKLVAISVSHLEADGLPKMQERAKASKFNFDYLYDASQKTARSLGALVTPHVFVFDGQRKLAYMGALDDNTSADKVERHYLRDAVEALLAGKPVEPVESRPRGCPIEYDEAK